MAKREARKPKQQRSLIARLIADVLIVVATLGMLATSPENKKAVENILAIPTPTPKEKIPDDVEKVVEKIQNRVFRKGCTPEDTKYWFSVYQTISYQFLLMAETTGYEITEYTPANKVDGEKNGMLWNAKGRFTYGKYRKMENEYNPNDWHTPFLIWGDWVEGENEIWFEIEQRKGKEPKVKDYMGGQERGLSNYKAPTCVEIEKLKNTQRASQRAPELEPAPPEADALVEKVKNDFVTRGCTAEDSETWYTVVERSFLQLREVKKEKIESEPVDPFDKENNGLTWRGFATITYSARRAPAYHHVEGGGVLAEKWGPWERGGVLVRIALEKRNGEVRIVSVNDINYSNGRSYPVEKNAPSCQAIENMKPTP